MKLQIPEDVQWILNTLSRHGFEAYIVGGCVRDILLDRTPDDWDVTTSALPDQIRNIFPNTLDTGIQHGTITVLTDKHSYEVTTYRLDGVYEDGRHPVSVTFTQRLEEDLKRRDFTMNALAYHPEKGIVDLFHGREDLHAGIIRCIGDPMVRFSEDALRMMRAVRFAAQLGFSLDSDLMSALKQLSEDLRKISAERIQTELVKIILSDHPEALLTAFEAGMTSVFLPELDACMRTESDKGDSMGESVIAGMRALRKDLILRLVMLFHQMEERTTRKALQRLHFPRGMIEEVCILIRWQAYHPEADEVTVRKMMGRIGAERFSLYLEIQKAMILSRGEKNITEQLAGFAALEQIYVKICRRGDCVSLKEMKIKGADLIQSGYKSGKEIGKILDILLEHVLEHPEDNTKERLLEVLPFLLRKEESQQN